MERIELYNNYLVAISKMSEVPVEEVDAVFTRNLPSNDYEVSQMINNLADFVDSETLISQLSFIKDASEIVEAKKKEDETKPKDPYDDLFKDNQIGDANVETQEDTGNDSEDTKNTLDDTLNK